MVHWCIRLLETSWCHWAVWYLFSSPLSDKKLGDWIRKTVLCVLEIDKQGAQLAAEDV